MTALSLLTNTRDRADSLERLLASVDTAEAAELDAEVVVVDNGSTDRTREVVEDFAATAKCRVQYVYEPKAGASRAKNAGVRAATGEILAFTDDDCVLDPSFLREALAAFELGRFDWCGGRALLLDETDAVYTVLRSPHFRLFPPHRFIRAGTVLGLCMAWRASLVRDLGMFDEMLGPGTPFRGDEIDLCARAAGAGYWGAYVPSMVVYHGHGRKPGTAELVENMRGNDYARGAYYAKFLLAGRVEYLWGWGATTRRYREAHDLRTELAGAAHYVAERIRRRRR